ncbi:polysaccharide deacetylase family protein [Sporosarcina sp. HYO08]|uniref:polysaccharide deacetylase family protein n=1 Tax=Sporosarcina sp. HYO08 TaxID=1759557 RepID=UPI000795A54D|nr:polysaccharide deacetylase family protein [Sporosarcina sp. HYO08]KXH84008.1 hypothetical protein AU377_04445 [Sporosarcina sp. HYO08]
MKKSIFFATFALFLCLLFTAVPGGASAKNKSLRYVGLHDRLLPLESVRVIDGDTKVAIDEIVIPLHASLEKKDGQLFITKNGHKITYDLASKKTTSGKDPAKGMPIVEVDGKLFISVRYLAKETGFQVDYLPGIQTVRMYRTDYQHVSHPAFEYYVKSQWKKKQAVAASKKANVYLTFDDGPNAYTMKNKNTLRKYNVQGTFFFLGKHMKKHEDIVISVSMDGNYIGSHSMTHDVTSIYKSPQSFIDEMSGAAKMIQDITGEDARLLRVPYGSIPHVTPTMREELNKNGYKMWDWSVDSNDWRYTDQQANEIIKNVQNGVKKADGLGNRDIVVLMHDRSATSKALPEIIKWLQKEGYEIKKYEPEQHSVVNFLHDKNL